MKVDIRVRGESLELKPGSNLELELNNPAAGYDSVLGSRALNLQIINSQRNRAILAVSSDPRRRDNDFTRSAEIYAGGDLIDYGTLYLRDLKGGLEMDYTSLLSEYFGPLQKLKLSGLEELGTIEIPSTWNATLTHTWEIGGYVLPVVHDPLFFKERPVGWDERLNSFAGSYVVGSPKVPCFFLKYILNKIGILAGVKFSGEFWEDCSTLVVFNTQQAGEHITIKDHMPDITVSELIISLRKAFNLYLGFDVATRTLTMDYADKLRTAAATVDWSDRFPRIKGGGGSRPGSIIFEVAGDSSDSSFSDEFFASYVKEYASGESMKITCSMASLRKAGGLLYSEMTSREVGKDYKLLRLLNYPDGPLQASNVFGGTVMNLEGLFEGYYSYTGSIEADGYVVQMPAALSALDCSWISRCFKGRGQAPVVHAQGVNWELLQLVVGFGSSRISSVKMRRLT